jgi:hypothetical protein
MPTTDDVLRAAHAELIQGITQEVNHYLDCQQRFHLLWADVDNHIAASHLAESLGNSELVKVHLQAVNRLMEDIYSEYPPNRNNLGFWFGAHAECKPYRDLVASL